MGLSGSCQTSIEGTEFRIPLECGRQGGSVERRADLQAAAADASLARLATTVVVERSEAGQACGLFPTDAAQLGHADDKRDGGAQPDARHALYEIETLSEILMLAQSPLQASKFAITTLFGAPDICLQETTQAWLLLMLKRVLARTRSSSACSMKTRRSASPVSLSSAFSRSGQSMRAVKVAISMASRRSFLAAQPSPGEGLHLQRLVDDDLET